MSITAAEFKIRFPEFVGETDARVNVFIADAVLVVNESQFGTKYDLGLYYLTAHYLYMANKSADGSTTVGGPIASRAVDGTSVSYQTVGTDNEWKNYLLTTTYGQRYLAIIRTLPVNAFTI